jgi:hypothetical protein
MGWRNRPKFIDYCSPNIDYTLFIDENGSDDLKDILKSPSKYKNKKEVLTITGVAIKTSDLQNIKKSIMVLKNKYWRNGLFPYKGKTKRVCLHSRDIRRMQGPFNPKIINYNNFINDLTDTIKNLPMTIFSSSINKVKHCQKYYFPVHPYNLCLNFIIERFAKYFLDSNKTAIIVLEAQGKDHDKFSLEHIKYFLNNGNNYVTVDDLKKIKGVYFNNKWCKAANDLQSYFGLEIADLCSYPIHKFVRSNIKDSALKSFEHKIYNYPNYFGYGIKIFP